MISFGRYLCYNEITKGRKALIRLGIHPTGDFPENYQLL